MQGMSSDVLYRLSTSELAPSYPFVDKRGLFASSKVNGKRIEEIHTRTTQTIATGLLT